jgi:hypothetical protein
VGSILIFYIRKQEAKIILGWLIFLLKQRQIIEYKRTRRKRSLLIQKKKQKKEKEEQKKLISHTRKQTRIHGGFE